MFTKKLNKLRLIGNLNTFTGLVLVLYGVLIFDWFEKLLGKSRRSRASVAAGQLAESGSY